MKQFLFGVSLLACISAMTQINHPLVEEGKVWHYVASNARPEDGTHIYDLQGRRLQRDPEQGIYIKDGKKIAVTR